MALGLAYAAVYRLIVLGSSFGASVGATFWPASGLTVSVLILRARREWPLYLIAVWIADFLMDTHGGGGYTVREALGIATANCVEPLLSATLLRRWLGGRPDLSNGRDLGLFYLAAVGCGPLLSGIISSSWQWLADGRAIWPFLGRWYVGDALGVTIVAPLVLSVARQQSRATRAEGWAVSAVLVLAGVALTLPFSARVGVPFLLVPIFSLIAIKCGTRAAAVSLFLVGVVVEVLTAVGAGPFAGGGAFTGLLSAQMYLVACSASGLTAGALMAGLVSRDRLALQDSLTGLANRRLLLNRTSLSIARLAHAREVSGLVFIDLDGFKTINDRHGHMVGDRVLIEIARRLQTVVDQRDTVARIGGDEFVILASRGVDAEIMSGLVERVERVIAEPIDCLDVSVEVGASIGFALCDQQDERPEEVLSRADQAMYGIKRDRIELRPLAV